jgi:hypothetical protein
MTAMWKVVVTACMLLGLASSAGLAQEKGSEPALQIVDVEGSKLDLFDAKDGRRIDSVPRERVLPLLPVKVLVVEPNKRLKITLPGSERPVWVERRQVRTNEIRETQGACPAGTREAPPKIASSMIATRGLGEICR